MNRNRSSHASNISPNSHPQFFIKHSEIAYADITFVEKVLAILIESRFGPGFEYQKLEKPSDLPDFEPVLFSDLLVDDVTVSFWDARYSGRKRECERADLQTLGRTRCLTWPHSAKFSGTQNPGGGNASVNERAVSRPPITTNQGRGSP